MPSGCRLATQILAVTGVVLAMFPLTGMAEASIESTYAEHTRGVELARAGRHGEGLAVLLPLLDRFPDDYPLQRDVVLITTWKGDCPEALRRFERIRSHRHPAYLVVPVSDCLLKANRPREARWLTRTALARDPDSSDLQNAYQRADLALRLDQNVDEESPALVAELGVRKSERNLAEWMAYLEGSAQVATRARLYGRYRGTRTLDSAYRDGDFDRVGLGVRYRFDERWLLDQEFSADINEGGQGGSTTRLTWDPRDDWRLKLMHATFSEEMPLRARAAGSDARQSSAEASYQARDYRWDGSVSFNHYEFSDGNLRNAFYAIAGYAYEMRARREQRLYVEAWQSQNSLDGTTYFNPSHDHAVGLVHKTDFIYDSRFRRHVDHLWIGVSAYSQQGYDTQGRWRLGYEQDYDFNDHRALAAGAELARNVYDGKPETEWRLYLNFRQRY